MTQQSGHNSCENEDMKQKFWEKVCIEKILKVIKFQIHMLTHLENI